MPAFGSFILYTSAWGFQRCSVGLSGQCRSLQDVDRVQNWLHVFLYVYQCQVLNVDKGAIDIDIIAMKRLLLLLSVLLPMTLLAQRERNYVYLLDCTKSMTGYGGNRNIWKSTKDYLKAELEKHSPGTTIHVIPFQGKVHQSFDFDAANFGGKKWQEIEDKINVYVEDITGTNICDAWDVTNKYINLHKDNYIILLTDGKDNVKGMTAVAKKMSEWCGKYPNTYAFYVQLTEAAIDQGVSEVIDICDNEFVVDASNGIPVFGSFDNDLIVYANTLNLDKTHKLSLSSTGKYGANVVCEDPYFDVNVVNNKIDGGIVPIQIVAKQPIAQINASIPQTYYFSFYVRSNEINIINPIVKVQMTNKPERTLEMLSEETDMGKATWYDSFLFWGTSNPDTLSIDLKTVFNGEAKKDGSAVELNFADPDGGKDFQLFYNGQVLNNGNIILRSNDKTASVLSIVFNSAAKEGRRYLTGKAITKQELDNINDQPIEQYQLTLRSKYVVKWNPLKTILMWLSFLTLTFLLLWFFLIKYIVYPTIKVKTIQINDPYFSKVNIKGKRRVVFTNRQQRQSLLNRIFTGEILYKIHDCWTSPLIFEAGAKKKTLRVRRTKDYVFDSYTSMLKAPNDYVVENTNDNTKIKISIN